MRTLSSDIRAAIDTMNQGGIWAHLYEISLDGVTKLYKTDHQLPITYNSQVYSPYPIAIGEISQSRKPEDTKQTITVANIDKAIATHLEGGLILGQIVVVTWVFLKESDDSPVFGINESYQVLGCELATDKQAWVFEVGRQNLFKEKLPRNRWIDFRCEHVYRSLNRCHYGRDEFEGISTIDLKQGGDGDKVIFGWRALNMANCTSAGINISASQRLKIAVANNVDVRWQPSPAVRSGPFIYRILDLSSAEVSDDFAVEVTFAGNPNEVGETEGILISGNSDTTNDWVYFCRKVRSGSTVSIAAYRNNGGTGSTLASAESTNVTLKIVKTGSTFDFYHKNDENASYGAAFASTTLTALQSAAVRMGIAIETESASRASVFTAEAKYFHLLSGGYNTCNRTITDCRTRQNIRRFGGAPGLVHGPLVL